MNNRNLYEKIHKNLSVGQEVKNYKELCKILGIKEEAGNSKKAQIKSIECYCLLKKEGHKFIVKEIYADPLIKADKRQEGSHSIYVKLIESILLHYFIEEDKLSCNLSKSQLYRVLGMTNDNYLAGLDNKKELHHKLQNNLCSDYWKLKSWHIDDFYSRSRKKLDAIIQSALGNLETRKLISCTKILMARKTNDDGSFKYFKVTDEKQIAEIMKIERSIIDKMVGATKIVKYKKIIKDSKTGKDIEVEEERKEPTTVRDILYKKNATPSKNYDEYRKKVNNAIKKTLGFDFVYRTYSIICNQAYLERALNENAEELKEVLNKDIIEYLDAQAKERMKKNYADLKAKETKFRYDNHYLEMQKYLSNVLLNINEAQLNDFLENIALDAEINELFAS